MNLSNEQLKQFEDEGYIFLPKVFSKNESELLKKESEMIPKD